MDDPRLSRMYARVVSRSFGERRRRTARWIERHNRELFRVGIALLVIAAGIGYYAHLHGRFRRLKTQLKAMNTPVVEQPLLLGGQEATVLQRPQLGDSSAPEFLSATLLPGRGMGVLQLTAYVPGHGEVSLLDAPTLEAAAALLTGTGTDAAGQASFGLGGPVQFPWAGSIPGQIGGDGKQVLTDWHGRNLSLPLSGRDGDVGLSTGGLLLKAGAESVSHNIMPDGGTVQTSFDPADFDGSWPSQIHVTMTALLSSRSFELRLQARNEGKESAPVGVGWMPRFVLPGGSLRNALLRVPADQREEMRGGQATGHTPSIEGTALDFSERGGKRIGSAEIGETFVHLKTGFLDNGPVLEVRDPDSGLGLRMTAMSPQIRAIHVQTSPTGGKITFGFQTNYDDPFSRTWSSGDDKGIQVLQPGQTMQWKVRLEVFQLNNSELPPL